MTWVVNDNFLGVVIITVIRKIMAVKKGRTFQKNPERVEHFRQFLRLQYNMSLLLPLKGGRDEEKRKEKFCKMILSLSCLVTLII